MDNIIDLLFGSIYDKTILKLKRLRARLLLRKFSGEVEWFQPYSRDPKYIHALLHDENLLNLFMNRQYRLDLCEKPDVRTEFMKQLETTRETYEYV